MVESRLSTPDKFKVLRAWGVHLLTASGVIVSFLALAETASPACDPRWVLFWFALATLIDAVDGPLARRWEVKRHASSIEGRTVDDIVDYLNFTFLPLFFIWRMGWLPWAGTMAVWSGIWVIPAMMASALAFAGTRAKQESAGFFAGFPSYWNLAAYFAGLLFVTLGGWANAIMIGILTVLTLAPVRFVYPNHAPGPWRLPVLLGCGLWLALALWTLPDYPHPDPLAAWVLFAGVALYTALSVALDRRAGRRT